MSWTINCFIFVRFVLPVTLLASSVMRVNLISLMYGCGLLIMPLLSLPKPSPSIGLMTRFTIFVMAFSFFVVFGQTSYQVYTMVEYKANPVLFDTFFTNCLLYGRQDVAGGEASWSYKNVLHILSVVWPDLVVFVISLITFIICHNIRWHLPDLDTDVIYKQKQVTRSAHVIPSMWILLFVCFLAIAAIINPSALHAVYLLVMFVMFIQWSCSYEQVRWLAFLRLFVVGYSALHLILLYAYQFRMFRAALHPSTFIARFFGLIAIVKLSCKTPAHVDLEEDSTWSQVFMPVAVFCVYYVAAMLTHRWMLQIQFAMNNPENMPRTPESVHRMDSRYHFNLLMERRSQSITRDVGSGPLSSTVAYACKLFFGEKKRKQKELLDNWSVSDSDSIADEDEAVKRKVISLLRGHGRLHAYDSLSAMNIAEQDQPRKFRNILSASLSENLQNRNMNAAAAGVAHGFDANMLLFSARSNTLSSFLSYFNNHIYVATLIMMMAWSVTFQHLMSFLFLVAACVIWVLPQQRAACLVASPFIILHAFIQVFVQYVFSFDVAIPIMYGSGGFSVYDIAIKKHKVPFIPLAAMLGYTVVFWMTFKQYIWERLKKKRTQSLSVEDLLCWRPDLYNFNEVYGHKFSVVLNSDTLKRRVNWIWCQVCKYWVVVCVMMHLVMLQEAVLYRIVYLVSLIFFILSLQMNFQWWRLMSYMFWWTMIIYSMIVVSVKYTFNFETTGWANLTSVPPEILQDIGLMKLTAGEMIHQQLQPTIFIIVCNLQVHYFHTSMMRLTIKVSSWHSRFKLTGPFQLDDFVTPDEVLESTEEQAHKESNGTQDSQKMSTGRFSSYSKEHEVGDEGNLDDLLMPPSIWQRLTSHIDSACHHIEKLWTYVQANERYLWRFAEIHISKVVMLIIFIICILDTNAINCVLVFLVLTSMPIQRIYWVFSKLCMCWISLAMLSIAFFQLSFAPHNLSISICKDNDTSMIVEPLAMTSYLGIHRDTYLLRAIKNYLVIMFALALEAIVKIHQKLDYCEMERPCNGILFPEITRKQADVGIVCLFKFFANYMFYKFGLELCYVMTVITMVWRMDAYAVIYGVMLGLILMLSRRRCYFIWPLYLFFLYGLLLLQYIASVGFPPISCLSRPFDRIGMGDVVPSFGFLTPMYTTLLITDFFQFMFACQQWYVFIIENNHTLIRSFGGGNNTDIYKSDFPGNWANPTHDFLSSRINYVEYIKVATLPYIFWVNLVILFIAGATAISFYCMGYLMATFTLLWVGHDLLVQSPKMLRRVSCFLLSYNYGVILCKCSLQLLACNYPNMLANHCWLVQVLSIMCLQNHNYSEVRTEYAHLADIEMLEEECLVADKHTVGLLWDVVSFIFLLLLLRLFGSHYFSHIVLDIVVQRSLATRGEELVNTNLVNLVKAREKRDIQMFNKIKAKMELLKKRHPWLDAEQLNAADHYFVIRSGNYLMFQEEEVDNGEEYIDKLSGMELFLGDKDQYFYGPMEILHIYMKHGIPMTLSLIDKWKAIRLRNEMGKDIDFINLELSFMLEKKYVAKWQSYVKKMDIKRAQPKHDDRDPTCTEYVQFIWLLFCSFIDYTIFVLRGVSTEYRSISMILHAEKELGKAKIKADQRKSLKNMQPEDYEKMRENRGSAGSQQAIFLEVPAESEPQSYQSEVRVQEHQHAEHELYMNMSRLLRLGTAVINATMSHFNLVIYLIMIINIIVNGDMLSLPYPFFVFLWGMLAVPRPDSFYWVTIITYTEIVLLVKYMFQFRFFTWNDANVDIGNPFSVARFIGIQRSPYYAISHMILLFSLFIHRAGLKNHGLWKSAGDINKDFLKAHGLPEEDEIQRQKENKRVSPVSLHHSQQDSRSLVYFSDELVDFADRRPPPPKSPTSVISVFSGDDIGDNRRAKRPIILLGWMHNFYTKMVNSEYSMSTDVYATMFFCDVVSFIIAAFSYSSFVPLEETKNFLPAGAVTSVIRDNEVPVPFLMMLMVHFSLTLADRAIYLRKNVFAKLLMQVIQMIGVHTWMFFILPAITKRQFTQNIMAQLWYFVRCLYFGLSAYQIRCGYPKKILGNFLTKNYNYSNLFLFKGFLIIPFLLELRCLMDWIWTDTSLALRSWMQVEDIYANVFVLECWRRSERYYITPRGENRPSYSKYGVGGIILFLLIFVVWMPLILFSLAQNIYVVNTPIDCSVKFQIGSYEPVYEMESHRMHLSKITHEEYVNMTQTYMYNLNIVKLLSVYGEDDIYIVDIPMESNSIWTITPPQRQSLINDLQSNQSLHLHITVHMLRDPSSRVKAESAFEAFEQELLVNETAEFRNSMVQLLSYNSDEPAVLKNITLPKYVRVTNNGRMVKVPGFVTEIRNVSMSLKRENNTWKEWWEIHDISDDNGRPHNGHNFRMFTFHDRIPPTAISFVTQYGVIGLYLSLVLVIGRFVRIAMTGMSFFVMYEEIPNVTPILSLCLDIYLVRESRDFRLEEELFAKLIFLYRSPETLIKFTQQKLKQS